MNQPILLLDNFDSFTYNLYHLLYSVSGTKPVVMRNDLPNAKVALEFETVVLSPGPGLPQEASKLMEVIDLCWGKTKILGVCLGHQAIALARSCKAMAANTLPNAYLAKGNYFSLAGRSPFSRLIYPVPEPGGLGVHLTLDLGQQARFGPDVEWVDAEDYNVNLERADVFYGAIRKYWPDLADGALQPAYAGIRPKIVPQGRPDADFKIQGPDEHGVPGLVNLFGIESPGLTSSLEIHQYILDKSINLNKHK